MFGLCSVFVVITLLDAQPRPVQRTNKNLLIRALQTKLDTHTHTLRALTCLDKGPETGGFSRVLGVVGIISIFMY